MNDIKLRPIEIDAIGELLNISLGTAATSASNMLSTRVSITTPKVEIKTKADFDIQRLEPAVAVDIAYVEGITGNSIMILKLSDIRMIVDMLLGTDTPEEEFALDELSVSAVCEVMNQMMGASATALSEILAKTVNISPPIAKEIEDVNEFKESCFKGDDKIAVVTFDLMMGDKMKSEFINMLAIPLVKELVSGFIDDEDDIEEQSEPQTEPQALDSPDTGDMKEEVKPQVIEGMQNMNQNITNEQMANEIPVASTSDLQVGATLNATQIEQPAVTYTPPIAEEQPAVQSSVNSSVDANAANQLVEMMKNMMELMNQQMQMNQMNMSRGTQKIKTESPLMSNLNSGNIVPGDFDGNLDMLMGVPIDVSVEIGRSKKLIKDVLEINKGSLIVLDRLAGEHVDLFANGQLVAKGDVVVIDDNFGIRVTELISRDIFGEE